MPIPPADSCLVRPTKPEPYAYLPHSIRLSLPWTSRTVGSSTALLATPLSIQDRKIARMSNYVK